jgi:rubrerythrin
LLYVIGIFYDILLYFSDAVYNTFKSGISITGGVVMNNLQKILKFAMRMEKDAEDFYSFYYDKVESEKLKQLFFSLAEIEKEHYNILKKKYDELSFTDPPQVISWVVDNSSAAKDPHILSDNSELIQNPDSLNSDLMIIRMAYLIENDFSEFYKNATKVVDNPEAATFLKTLADWEEGHKNMFYSKYQKLLKNYWQDAASIIFTK